MTARFFLCSDVMSTDYINRIPASFGFHFCTSKLFKWRQILSEEPKNPSLWKMKVLLFHYCYTSHECLPTSVDIWILECWKSILCSVYTSNLICIQIKDVFFSRKCDLGVKYGWNIHYHSAGLLFASLCGHTELWTFTFVTTSCSLLYVWHSGRGNKCHKEILIRN